MVSRLLLAALLCLTLGTSAFAQRSFTKRVGFNLKGNITIIGNTNMRGDDDRSGSQDNNDGWWMRHVDVDNVSTTFNSSSAQLTLPNGVSGSDVLWAGLYWQSYTNSSYAQSNNQNNTSYSNRYSNRYKITFGPGTNNYVQYTATQQDWISTSYYESEKRNDNDDENWYAYQGYIDVTDIVQAHGSTNYFAANIVCPYDYYGVGAGWSLVVLYKDATQPMRNIVVWDGYTTVRDNNPTSLTLSGFKTPSAPFTVKSDIGVVAFEGDNGITGDYLRLGANNSSNNLTDGNNNSGNNFFNSTISTFGTRFQSKNPNYLNQLGYDFHIVQTTNKLGNSQTSAQVHFGSDGDLYYPGVMFFSTETVGPSIQAEKYFYTTDPVQPLETSMLLELPKYQIEERTLLYHFVIRNTGDATAQNCVLIDEIPEHQEYVPGSMQISSDGFTWTTLNDAQIGDAGWFDNSFGVRGRVVIGFGTGATSTSGGSVLISNPTPVLHYVRFKTRIDDATNFQTSPMEQTEVPNRALVQYRDNTTNPVLNLESNSTEVSLFIYINVPFPVELTAFSASLRNKAVSLRWETATETNNYGFDVERSFDQEQWERIGFVAGSGTTSSPKNYTHRDDLTDAQLSSPAISYRLKQIDRDGKITYSSVVTVIPAGGVSDVTLQQNFPNPFNPSTSIAFHLPGRDVASLTVYNELGVEVARLLDGTELDAGWHTVAFDASALSSGRYYYRLNTAAGSVTKTMIVSK